MGIGGTDIVHIGRGQIAALNLGAAAVKTDQIDHRRPAWQAGPRQNIAQICRRQAVTQRGKTRPLLQKMARPHPIQQLQLILAQSGPGAAVGLAQPRRGLPQPVAKRCEIIGADIFDIALCAAAADHIESVGDGHLIGHRVKAAAKAQHLRHVHPALTKTVHAVTGAIAKPPGGGMSGAEDNQVEIRQGVANAPDQCASQNHGIVRLGPDKAAQRLGGHGFAGAGVIDRWRERCRPVHHTRPPARGQARTTA
jgi:hypothetical protein